MANNDDSESDRDEQTITDIERFERQPGCTKHAKCGKVSSDVSNARRHERTCV